MEQENIVKKALFVKIAIFLKNVKMKEIRFLDKVDVISIIHNELRKKEKLISLGEIKQLIKLEIVRQNKNIYKILDKMRKNETKM